MLDIELPDSASDLVLVVLFQKIVGLVVADIVSLSKVLVDPSLELTTNLPCSPNFIGLADIHQKIWII